MTIKQVKKFLKNNQDCKIFGLLDFGSFSELLEVDKSQFIALTVWRDDDDFINAYVKGGQLIIG